MYCSGAGSDALAETTVVLVDLIRRGHRTIAFTRSRKGTELVYRWARDRLGDLGDRIAAFSCYLPQSCGLFPCFSQGDPG